MIEARPYYLGKPGIHSYNRKRFTAHKEPRGAWARSTRVILILVGLAALGYYGYTIADQQVFQAYGNWAFEQQIAGRSGVTFRDYLRERTPFSFLAGERTSTVIPDISATPANSIPISTGDIIGRVEIERLHLSAVVRQGVDDKTLGDSVGHVPSTAMPGEAGNFAIAAHRDTLFRALKDIQNDDLISFQSPSGTFNYQVASTRIVWPTDVSVLRSDGGGLIPAVADAKPPKLLTMITCYPFYYVGSAPKRFIVEAKLISQTNRPTNRPGTVGMVK